MSFRGLLLQGRLGSYRKLVRRLSGMTCQATTDRVLMVRPTAFASNPETALDNAFQDVKAKPPGSGQTVQAAALGEFEGLVRKLREAGVEVTIFEDEAKLPDAIFPNNWISFHKDEKLDKNVISIFPMLSVLRREERRKDIVDHWAQVLKADVRDYTRYEADEMYLEGTGSMVVDRLHSKIYANISQRTHSIPLEQFCKDFKLDLISFRAYSKSPNGAHLPIYHTNVMLQVMPTFAVVCFETITDVNEQKRLRESLEMSGKDIVSVSMQQVSNYACNILQLKGSSGQPLLVMSTRAYKSFTAEQLAVFERHSCSIVHSDVQVVEDCGGGSARCMIAEVFPARSD